jgi:hypothetical protein
MFLLVYPDQPKRIDLTERANSFRTTNNLAYQLPKKFIIKKNAQDSSTNNHHKPSDGLPFRKRFVAFVAS